MPWTKKTPEHECSMPATGHWDPDHNRFIVTRKRLPDVTTGDIWECDNDECTKTYTVTVVNDQHDGDYVEFNYLAGDYIG